MDWDCFVQQASSISLKLPAWASVTKMFLSISTQSHTPIRWENDASMDLPLEFRSFPVPITMKPCSPGALTLLSDLLCLQTQYLGRMHQHERFQDSRQFCCATKRQHWGWTFQLFQLHLDYLDEKFRERYNCWGTSLKAKKSIFVFCRVE